MSSKKSPKSSWSTCTSCQCHVLNRDMVEHASLCTADRPYVAKMGKKCHTVLSAEKGEMIGVLNRAPRDVLNEVLKKLSGWPRRNVIVLHPSTSDRLQLSHLIAVKFRVNGVTEWKHCLVYPCAAVGQTAMYTVDPSIDLPSSSADKEIYAQISSSPSPTTAGHLHLIVASSALPPTSFLSTYLRHAVVEHRQTVSVDYMGRRMDVTIRVENEVDEIVRVTSQMQLRESAVNSFCGCLYRVTDETRITVDPSLETSARPAALEGQSLVGMQSTISTIEQFVTQPIISHLSPTRSSHRPTLRVSSIVLHGPSGTGKSLVLRTLQSTLRSVTNERSFTTRRLESRFDCEQMTQLCNGEIEEEEKPAPMLILVDDVASVIARSTSTLSVTLGATADELLQSHDEANPADWACFAELIDAVAQYECGAWIVTTIEDLDVMPKNVRRRFDVEVETCVPNEDERHQLLRILIDPSSTSPALYVDQLASIASSAHGYTAADLVALVKQANTKMMNEEDNAHHPSLAHLQYALAHTRASAMREISLEVPHVPLSSVGGYEEVKTRLMQTVVWPLKNAAVFKRLNVQPSSGVLMFGPPGCSKTLLARALATESGLNFISVKGPELFSAFVGESEKAVRALFARARHAAPAIVFFDEIDALAQTRGVSTASSSVGDRVVAQLLTELDGLEPLHGVVIIAATNRPDTIDRALLRPGRIDTCIYVPLPDEQARRAILEQTLAGMPCDKCVDVTKLIVLTEGYSGAEVVGVCREAALTAMREDMDVQRLTFRHFEGALTHVRPQTDVEMLELYDEFGRGAAQK